MKWFKHFSNASSSLKLNGLIDKMGVEGYGRYWLLFELLAEKFDGSNTNIHLHERELIRSTLLRYPRTLRDHLGTMSGLDLFTFTVSGKFYEINCPMLLELQDKDSKYNRSKRTPERSASDPKNKNKKENKNNTPVVPFDESIRTEIGQQKFNPAAHLDAKKILSEETPQGNLKKFTPDEFVDLWNEVMGKKLPYTSSLGGGKHRDNFLAALEFLPTAQHWRDLLTSCLNSPRMMGQNSIGWTVTPTWIVDYDNALKVLNGDFDDDKVVRAIFASMPGETA